MRTGTRTGTRTQRRGTAGADTEDTDTEARGRRRSLSLFRRATKGFPERVHQRLSVASLRCVVAPPRIVAAFVAGRRQGEQSADRCERAGAIASAPGQLAQRHERRLRRGKQRGGPFEAVASVVELAERLFRGAEKQLAVVPQRGVADARQSLPQLGGRFGVAPF